MTNHVLPGPQSGQRATRPHRRGTATVELAVLLPLISAMLLGLWEGARMVEVQQIMSMAARETARQAASGGLLIADVQTVAVQYLKDAGLPDYTATASSIVSFNIIANLSSPALTISTPTDPSSLQHLDEFTVTLTVPFKDVRWFGLGVISTDSTKLSVTVTWCAISDAAPSSLSEPPTG